MYLRNVAYMRCFCPPTDCSVHNLTITYSSRATLRLLRVHLEAFEEGRWEQLL